MHFSHAIWLSGCNPHGFWVCRIGATRIGHHCKSERRVGSVETYLGAAMALLGDMGPLRSRTGRAAASLTLTPFSQSFHVTKQCHDLNFHGEVKKRGG